MNALLKLAVLCVAVAAAQAWAPPTCHLDVKKAGGLNIWIKGELHWQGPAGSGGIVRWLRTAPLCCDSSQNHLESYALAGLVYERACASSAAK